MSCGNTPCPPPSPDTQTWTNTETSCTASCESPLVGEDVTVVVPAATYTSFISQQDANDQAYVYACDAAEAALVCSEVIYFNVEQNAEYTANCPEGQIGEPSTGYGTIETGVYSSSVSQEAADALAYAAALEIATDNAIAGLECSPFTEWRQVIKLYADYWLAVVSTPGTIAPNTAPAFSYSYSGPPDASMFIEAYLNEADSGFYDDVEFDFDYVTLNTVDFRGEDFPIIGPQLITTVSAGSGHFNFIADRNVVGNSVFFGTSPNFAPSPTTNLIITNFRYRFR